MSSILAHRLTRSQANPISPSGEDAAAKALNLGWRQVNLRRHLSVFWPHVNKAPGSLSFLFLPLAHEFLTAVNQSSNDRGDLPSSDPGLRFILFCLPMGWMAHGWDRWRRGREMDRQTCRGQDTVALADAAPPSRPPPPCCHGSRSWVPRGGENGQGGSTDDIDVRRC